jgi:hypothetical protein
MAQPRKSSQPARRPSRLPRGPNWPLVIVILGIGIGALVLGLFQLLRPVLQRTSLTAQTADAISVIREWNPIYGTQLQGDPVPADLGNGVLQITATYAGTATLNVGDIQVFCQTVPMPPGWTLASCSILPGQPTAFEVVIQRGALPTATPNAEP